MDDERFRAITMEEIRMPPGWSDGRGANYLYADRERELRQQVRAWAQRGIAPEVAEARRRVDETKATLKGTERREALRAIAKEYLQKLAQAGFLAPTYPQEWGGGGLGVVSQTVIDEELAAVGHPGESVKGVSITLGSISVLRFGTEAQKRRHLPPRLRGEELAALAITEPQVGSDTARMQTRAVLKGERWVISGQKRFITGAGLADFVTLFAITDPGVHPHKGMSCFIVPTDRPGFHIRKQLDEHILADWMDNVWLELDDVEIPRENLLGPLNGGYHVLMDELDTERVTYCAASLGVARRALEIAAEYSTKRVQFGKPIAAFEGVSFKLAEMQADIDASRQLVLRTARMIEDGVSAQRESAVTKLFVAQAVNRVVDTALQVLGGAGYTDDFPIERMFRELRLLRIGAGSDEIMKFLIARELLKEIGG